jgi:hypothetical protein
MYWLALQDVEHVVGFSLSIKKAVCLIPDLINNFAKLAKRKSR